MFILKIFTPCDFNPLKFFEDEDGPIVQIILFFSLILIIFYGTLYIRKFKKYSVKTL